MEVIRELPRTGCGDAADAWSVSGNIHVVASRPRTAIDLSGDGPDVARKPVDCPFGPYADQVDGAQHKCGRFASIVAARRQRGETGG